VHSRSEPRRSTVSQLSFIAKGHEGESGNDPAGSGSMFFCVEHLCLELRRGKGGQRFIIGANETESVHGLGTALWPGLEHRGKPEGSS